MKRLSVAVLFALACGGTHLPPDWKKSCGGHVVAALSSVTLANDCAADIKAAGPGFAGDAAPCAPGTICPSFCRQSSMQLQFASTAATASKIEILAVRVMDPTHYKVLESLSHREARQWSTDTYVAWDELLAPNATVKATYKLSAPNFASYASGRLAYGQTYRVEVDLTVDGVLRTLQVDAQREPEVAT